MARGSGAIEGGGNVFVGRAQELAKLRASLTAAQSGRGGVCLLFGEPGIGKTRLAAEVASLAAQEGAMVLWGRCWESGGAPAYWPWVQLLRRFAGEPAETEIGRVLQVWRNDLAPLLDRVSVPSGSGLASPSHDLDQTEFRLFDSTTQFLKAVAALHPIVILLDDLHGADRPSLLLLKFAARALQDARIFIVGTSREAEVRRVPALAALFDSIARDSVSIPLGGLSAADLGELIDGRAGAAEVSSSVADQILEVTGGNPFFIGEMLELLARQPELAGALRRDGLQVTVPDGVRAAIRRRLEPLDGDLRFVLLLASILGRVFDRGVLGRVASATLANDRIADALGRSASTPNLDLAALLRDAVTAGILVEDAETPTEFRFTHALIGEALRFELAPALRASVHAIAGEVLEALLPDRSEANFAELAHHFYQAAAVCGGAKAAEYSLQAGDQAFHLLAFEDAAAHYERALDAIKMNARDEARSCETLLRLGEAQRHSMAAGESGGTFAKAAHLARKVGDPTMLARAALGFCHTEETGSVSRERIAMLTEALEALGPDDSTWRARVLARLAMALYFADATERLALSAEAVAVARRIGDAGTLLTTLMARHLALWGPDLIEERLRIATEVTELAESVGKGGRASEGRLWKTVDLLESGDSAGFREAWVAFSQHEATARVPMYRWHDLLLRAMRALSQGKLAEAEELTEQARALGRRARIVRTETFYAVQLYYLRHRQGRHAELASAQQAMAEHFVAVPVWRCGLARILADSGRRVEAEAIVDGLAADDFAVVPRDGIWLAAMAELTEACVRLGDRARSAVLYDHLAPFSGRNVIIADGIAYLGPVSALLAKLATVLERWDLAAGHFEDALASAAGLGATLHVADCQTAYAEMLAGRRLAGDRARAAQLLQAASALYNQLGMEQVSSGLASSPAMAWGVGAEGAGTGAAAGPTGAAHATFRRDGHFWTVEFEGRAVRLKDSRGLFYLNLLLQHPDRPISCLELVAAAQGGIDPASVTGSRDRGGQDLEGMGTEGAGGLLLDEQAKRAYRERLGELQRELEEADSCHDPGRADRARAEIDAVTRELSASVGLGGRSRGLTNGIERARVAVTKAIVLGYRTLAEEHPALRAYFGRTIRTGQVCSFQPDPQQPVLWSL
jgi:hypothetical protein